LTETAPALRIGRVLKAHGVKGALRIELLTDFPDRFAPGHEVEVAGRRLTVARAEAQDGGLLVTFTGVDDRGAAELLTGAYCTLPLAEARPLPANRFYHFQLVGLTVVDTRLGQEIGRVAEVLTYDANDVLRVTSGDREVLIPMVRSVVRSITPAEGVITVELPEEETEA
jgi:16S rRNA processing protein RimM